MAVEKMKGYFWKKYAQSSQNQYHFWVIRKFGDTKIRSIEELWTFYFLKATYSVFYRVSHIEIMDKEHNAKTILEMLEENFAYYFERPLCNGGLIVGENFSECQQLKEEVVNYLEQFLLHTEETGLYTKAILKMESYCKKHEADYEEWETELIKYKNASNAFQKDFSRRMAMALGLGIGIGLLYFSVLQYYIQQSVEQNETEILEEQENVDETSLEDIDVEQILVRKL